ncbi:MAG: hypothetical protein IPK16_16340 [Anaerolineales bacterium]|nr:hypothetical protein [Anaerolineales bacterium]
MQNFRERWFRPRMIGVHLRRGDFLRARPDVAGGTPAAAAAVDAFLAQLPDAGIFLCTDDGAPDPIKGTTRYEGVREWFAARYGGRLVLPTPRSLDRSTPEAIQDAVVELWLLRSTDAFVGTRDSTFSGLAVLGRSIPCVELAAPTLRYGQFEWLARRVGAHQFITALGYRHFGRVVPFPALCRRYRRSVLHLLRDPDRAFRRKFPGKNR